LGTKPTLPNVRSPVAFGCKADVHCEEIVRRITEDPTFRSPTGKFDRGSGAHHVGLAS
jgi:hypothetical protein